MSRVAANTRKLACSSNITSRKNGPTKRGRRHSLCTPTGRRVSSRPRRSGHNTATSASRNQRRKPTSVRARSGDDHASGDDGPSGLHASGACRNVCRSDARRGSDVRESRDVRNDARPGGRPYGSREGLRHGVRRAIARPLPTALRMPPSASTRKQDCVSLWLLYFMRCRVRGMLRIATMPSSATAHLRRGSGSRRLTFIWFGIARFGHLLRRVSAAPAFHKWCGASAL